MSKRLIDLSAVLKDFDGQPIKSGDSDVDLKFCLITYIRQSGRMGLSDIDQTTLYVLGFLIGQGSGVIEVTTEQYDALKRAVDKGTTKTPNGQEEPVFEPVARFQIKELIDAASTIE